ncbi:MAG: hypothetical protein K2O36_05760 [Ruminococcus sp.]|nr:hypothetical protein [Ruminococcus sp.]
MIYYEVKMLTTRIVAKSEKYDKIVKDWLRQKPVHERKIKRTKSKF